MRDYPCLLCCAVLAAGLLGCSKADSGAAATGAAGTGAAILYELVTVERPESPKTFHNVYNLMYDQCVTMREALGLPKPAPMLQPAADFIKQRTTYTSDGKAYLTKQEYFVYTVENEQPTPTCRTYLAKSSNTQLIRDGKMYSAGTGHDGKRDSNPPQEWDLPRELEVDVYPQRKSVKGHAVKCMEFPAGTEGMITELCVADLNPGTIADADGRPIVVASRVTSVEAMMGAILTETVSRRVGLAVDKAVFDAAAAP